MTGKEMTFRSIGKLVNECGAVEERRFQRRVTGVESTRTLAPVVVFLVAGRPVTEFLQPCPKRRNTPNRSSRCSTLATQ